MATSSAATWPPTRSEPRSWLATLTDPITYVFQSVGYNLTNDPTSATCGFSASTDLVNKNPDLGPLANNGGPTQTLLPSLHQSGRQAVPLGAKPNGIYVCAGTDQRGVTRPLPGATACTVGAVEADVVVVTNPGNQSSRTGSLEPLTVVATDSSQTAILTWSANGLPSGLSIDTSTGIISGTPTTACTCSVTITATDNADNSATANLTWTVLISPQTVSFLSTPPAEAVVGGTYQPVTASHSGLAVTITLDAGSPAVA